jgi:FkbM family methyltransferase
MTNQQASISSLMDSILVMKPKPSPYRLKRIGRRCDGAYLIPDDLNGVEACFSPGVNNFKNFEDELTDTYRIKCHMCDFSSDVSQFKTTLREGMQTFKKKWLDIDGGIDSITLEDWIEELSPAADRDLLLQMDIEGAEYKNLLNCKDSVLKRFRIIVIEVHYLDVVSNVVEFEKELGPLLRKLDKNFICVHSHPNNCCGEFMLFETGFNIPNVHELTFLRRDRFGQVNASILHKPLIPHPLDISLNLTRKPPLFLSEAWCNDGSRDIVSKITMTRCQLDYIARKVWRQAKNTIKSLLPFLSRSM